MSLITSTPRDLKVRYEQIEAAYAHALLEHRALIKDLADDIVGDDVADAGAKAAASEQYEAELRVIEDRRTQLEHAMERIAAGGYGVCEDCGGQNPDERLALFPCATTCVVCKQRAERRA
jgi:DnaK suppressor protein